MSEQDRNLVSNRALGLLLLGALLLGGAYVLLPFVGALLWAIIMAVSTWPLYLRLSEQLGGRRSVAAFLVSVLFIVVLFVPLVAVVTSAAEQLPRAVAVVRHLSEEGLPPAPLQVSTWPIVGERLYELWGDAASQGSEILSKFAPQLEAVAKWILAWLGDFGLAILEFALAIIVAGVLLANAEDTTGWLRAVLARTSGERGVSLIGVAGRTIRSVTNGVIGTALVQGALATFGYLLAGLPGAVFLGFLSFLLAMMQIGPWPVWIPAAIWLGASGETGWAIFLAVWGVFPVNTIDNFIRPYLIGKGTSLPLLLIFAGVLGGLLAWGFIGIFLGATLLAVIYDLSREWIGQEQAPA